MSITSNFKEKVQRFGRKKKAQFTNPKVIGLGALEKTIHITTPFAALGAIGAKFNDVTDSVADYVVDPALKVLAGPYEAGVAAYKTVEAFVLNTGVRDAAFGVFGDLIDLGYNIMNNAVTHPIESLVVGLVTYKIGRETERVVEKKKDKIVTDYVNKTN